ncbi:conserved hypothetical protein [Neospora caninum Liverpool]|uniref:Uncharacterized protein n=1 Tax=Neospora caninum (strain Liverpool) TaxID=572307 RepID=F0VHT0_NEOCL|nr:conserved hypothetical protein [Neospora caninum Liverpool]CBZ53291.1 conserved hypothetical protein [Neospora caninum Liverpool]CEL67277.1 TPA: hypothetical protein BN1204_030780 [Neospora caninum Liverpool]|eukprot:XP_003883323.1 conserved hypothetical protein [Neospora caninum Liverpool]
MSRKNNRKFHRARHEAALKWEKEERKRREEKLERKAQLQQLTQALNQLGTTPKEQPKEKEETPEEDAEENLSEDMSDEEEMGHKKRSKKSKRQAGAKVKKILCKDASLKQKALARIKAREKKAMHSDDEGDKKVIAVVRGHRHGVKEIHRCRDKKVLRQILKRQRKNITVCKK